MKESRCFGQVSDARFSPLMICKCYTVKQENRSGKKREKYLVYIKENDKQEIKGRK